MPARKASLDVLDALSAGCVAIRMEIPMSNSHRTIMDLVDDVARQKARDEARKRESMAGRYLLQSLPRGLKRLVDHPKALRVYYRLRPTKRPTIVETRHPDGSCTTRIVP